MPSRPTRIDAEDSFCRGRKRIQHYKGNQINDLWYLVGGTPLALGKLGHCNGERKV